jgi:hypothetical protein
MLGCRKCDVNERDQVRSALIATIPPGMLILQHLPTSACGEGGFCATPPQRPPQRPYPNNAHSFMHAIIVSWRVRPPPALTAALPRPGSPRPSHVYALCLSAALTPTSPHHSAAPYYLSANPKFLPYAFPYVYPYECPLPLPAVFPLPHRSVARPFSISPTLLTPVLQRPSSHSQSGLAASPAGTPLTRPRSTPPPTLIPPPPRFCLLRSPTHPHTLCLCPMHIRCPRPTHCASASSLSHDSVARPPFTTPSTPPTSAPSLPYRRTARPRSTMQRDSASPPFRGAHSPPNPLSSVYPYAYLLPSPHPLPLRLPAPHLRTARPPSTMRRDSASTLSSTSSSLEARTSTPKKTRCVPFPLSRHPYRHCLELRPQPRCRRRLIAPSPHKHTCYSHCSHRHSQPFSPHNIDTKYNEVAAASAPIHGGDLPPIAVRFCSCPWP